MKLLEIAGSYKKGTDWDVIRDIPVKGGIQYDLRNLPIPFIKDNTYDGIYSEHFIEHLTKEEGIEFFKEMFRILKPGSVIRTVWPSMKIVNKLNNNSKETAELARLYNMLLLKSEKPFLQDYYKSYKEEIDNMTVQEQVAFRLLHQEGEHKHLWYVDEMIQSLKDLGDLEIDTITQGNVKVKIPR